MATWDDVRRLALSLPETSERPLRPSDLTASELVTEAWLLRAPRRLASAYLESAPQWRPPTDP